MLSKKVQEILIQRAIEVLKEIKTDESQTLNSIDTDSPSKTTLEIKSL